MSNKQNLEGDANYPAITHLIYEPKDLEDYICLCHKIQEQYEDHGHLSTLDDVKYVVFSIWNARFIDISRGQYNKRLRDKVIKDPDQFLEEAHYQHLLSKLVDAPRHTAMTGFLTGPLLTK